MSASTIRGRISLLAGSSLAAMTIMASAGGVAMLAPTMAMAANECAPIGTDPSANGSTADTYSCAGSYSGTGITYSSAGPLTVNSTGAMDVGVVGLNLTGNTSDSVTFTATGVVTGSGGPVIDVSSLSGPISITTAGITGTNTNVTYGIQAVSTGGGAITISNPTGTINVNSAAGLQQSAIRAVSTGGNGAVTVTTGAAVTGRLRGIEARSSGSGALTINANSSVSVNTTSGVPVAAIDARTGTGLLTINLGDANGAAVAGSSGSAILTNAGGDAIINIGNQRTVSGGSATTPMLNLTAVGSTTVNSRGTMSAGSNVLIRAAGGSFTLNSDVGTTSSTGTLTGRFDFSGVTGATTINNNRLAIWTTSGSSDFGSGASTLNNVDGATVRLSASATFTGLETFNNSAFIDIGQVHTGVASQAGQVLSMLGTAYIASGESVLLMDAKLDTTGQANCSGTLVADCISLIGGSTSGVTAIRLTAAGPIGTGANTDGITLVDVSGGTSHAGDFVLDLLSTNYAQDPKYGAVLTTGGWLGFALQYDDTAKRHYLVSVVPTQKLEYVASLQEVMSIWHGSSDTVAARQADLHDHADNRGAWLRVTGERTTRDAAVPYTAGGTAYEYDDHFEQTTTTAIGGLDLLTGDNFVFGVHAGGVKSELKRSFSPATDRIDGVTAGLYGSWWNDDGFSVDGTINGNFLKLTNERPTQEISDTNVILGGVRLEAGWRYKLAESFYVQPLASAAYVTGKIKDISQTGYKVTWQSMNSSRVALGVRVGGDAGLSGMQLGYWLTGRAWREFSGDGQVHLTANVGDVAFRDDLARNFEEVGAGLSLSNDSDTLRGYVSGGAKIADGVDDYSASFGLRLRW